MEAALERPSIPMRRAWAADRSSGSIPSMPIPPLPTSSSQHPQHSPALSTPEAKRRSAPFSTSRSRKRAEKKSSTAPEVISNLIDSLTTIDVSHELKPPSTPVKSARMSRTAPGTPVLRPQRSFGGESAGGRGFDGFSDDYSTYRDVLSADFLGADDAAEPPVIRTSKRPSGYSELTSPKVKSPPVSSALNGLGNYLRNGYARSTSSLLSLRDDDTKSVGNMSIDIPKRRRSITSGSIHSFESKTSGKGHKAMASQELYRGKSNDSNQIHETVLLATGLPIGISDHLYNPRMSSPKRLHPFNTPIEEEPSAPVPVTMPRPPEAMRTVSNGKKPVGAESPHDTSPAIGPSVPSRRSSLRHQDLPTPSKLRPSSRQSNLPFPNQTDTVAEVEEPKTRSGPNAVDAEDTEVTKRIKELKAKKEEREKEARQSTTEHMYRLAIAPPALPEIFEPPKSEKFTSKAQRVANMGGIHVPTRDASVEPRNGIVDSVAASTLSTQPDRPPTPLTPTALPINYSYVVQTLGQVSPPSSTKAPSTRSSILRSEKERRKSIAVGGRSAVSRNTVTKFVERSGPAPRYSSPDPSRFDTEEASERQSADTFDPTLSKNNRSSSVKSRRRRWSQPELPSGGLERNTSMRNSESLAVRAPETVHEERPKSRDSIDQDVISFIHSGRLSQKIRHPQSGRTIAFSEVGDPKGHAVFCCVGMGLTRYVTAFYDELAITLRLRLITPDRPGVGESAPASNGTPLSWPDDVSAICLALEITKFSIMAHSAGAIYALATALRMPQHIRGRVHLLAPWIPPSQMAPIGITNQDPPPGAQLPKSQRFLRVLPAPFLKVANTAFLSAASASLSPNGSGASPGSKKKRKSFMSKSSTESKETSRNDSRTDSAGSKYGKDSNTLTPPGGHIRRESIMLMDQQNMPDGSAITAARSHRNLRSEFSNARHRSFQEDEARREIYDSRLTLAIWEKATANANPAVDLLICLERHQPIGFMYKDITRAVVIHHGSKDTRVPVENVRWLGSAMRRCEVRVLEGQGHGLMAIPSVMGSVLEEIGREWRDWEEAVRRGADGEGKHRRDPQR